MKNTTYKVRDLDFAVRVFKCFESDHDQLWWMIRDNQLCLAAQESTYVWSPIHYTEFMDITPENIEILEKSASDLKATGDSISREKWLAALFISRIKREKPREEFLSDMGPATRALFDAINEFCTECGHRETWHVNDEEIYCNAPDGCNCGYNIGRRF